jgi:hypothetical protein
VRQLLETGKLVTCDLASLLRDGDAGSILAELHQGDEQGNAIQPGISRGSCLQGQPSHGRCASTVHTATGGRASLAPRAWSPQNQVVGRHGSGRAADGVLCRAAGSAPDPEACLLRHRGATTSARALQVAVTRFSGASAQLRAIRRTSVARFSCAISTPLWCLSLDPPSIDELGGTLAGQQGI